MQCMHAVGVASVTGRSEGHLHLQAALAWAVCLAAPAWVGLMPAPVRGGFRRPPQAMRACNAPTVHQRRAAAVFRSMSVTQCRHAPPFSPPACSGSTDSYVCGTEGGPWWRGCSGVGLPCYAVPCCAMLGHAVPCCAACEERAWARHLTPAPDPACEEHAQQGRPAVHAVHPLRAAEGTVRLWDGVGAARAVAGGVHAAAAAGHMAENAGAA